MARLSNDRSIDQLPDTTPSRFSPSVADEFEQLAAPSERGRFRCGNTLYFSRSEAACGVLMERFIPQFKICDGETFQVPIGMDRFRHMRRVDFLVNGVLVEFHQPRFWRDNRHHGDFASPREYREYRSALSELPASERPAFVQLTKAKLALQYYAKRESQIALSLDHSGKELVVATSPSDFYHKVIRRFGKDIPPEGEFLRLFNQICARAVDVRQETDSKSISQAVPELGQPESLGWER